VQVFAVLSYPNPGLHEMQADVVPKQVKQLLVQSAHGPVPAEVWPAGQAVQVFAVLSNPNPGLQETQADFGLAGENGLDTCEVLGGCVKGGQTPKDHVFF
jgi:hypothetical protein